MQTIEYLVATLVPAVVCGSYLGAANTWGELAQETGQKAFAAQEETVAVAEYLGSCAAPEARRQLEARKAQFAEASENYRAALRDLDLPPD